MRERLTGAFRTRSAQTLLFCAAAMTMVVVRFVVFASDGAPPTIDAGNWLAFGDSIFGGGVRDSTISYPPLVPVLTKLSVAVFGLTAGVSLVAAIAAVAPAVGVFVTLGACGLGRSRLFGSMVLLGVGSVGEAASWGGFPQLIGLGLLPYAVLSAHRFFSEQTTRWAAVFGVMTMAMLATSHFVAAVLVGAVLVLVVTRVVTDRSVVWLSGVLRLSPLVLLPSVWLVPVYVDLVDAVVVNPNEFADLDNLTADNFFDRLEGVYSDAPLLWRLLLPMTVIAPFLGWSVGRSSLVVVLRALFIAVAVLLLLSRESRYFYLLPTLAMLSVSLWIREAVRRVDQLPRRSQGRAFERKLAVAAVASLAVVGQAWAGVRLLDDQRYFYTAVSPGLVDAFEVARSATGPEDVLAIPSVRNAPLGWWAEALTDRPVVYGSALRWLNFEDEVERAARANQIFDNRFPTDESMDLLQASAVRVVVLPRTWEFFDDDRVASWIAENDLEVLLFDGDAVVLRLR